MRTTPEGLIIMTVYNTRTLAEAIIGEDEVAANAKGATRELRKFLRDDMGAGKAVVGKGGRYALELKAQELRNMKKRFAAWEAQQEADKAARAAAREAARPTTAPMGSAFAEANAEEDDIEVEDDDAPAEGPTDEEIAAMLEDDDEA